MLLSQPFLDVSNKLVPERVGFDERGLLGLAFHPDYTNVAATGHGKFYVFYSAPSTNAPGTVADPVDCRNGIPAGNPFVGEGAGIREEIFAFGLRNPWRFSFDVGSGGSGLLFVADVGQGRFEEINIVTNGGNYGWRVREGGFDFDATAPNGGLPLVDPIAQYAHPGETNGPPQIGLSVTGGYVYRGSEIPALSGVYVFADWSASFGTPLGSLIGLQETAPNAWSLGLLPVAGGNPISTRIMAFGRDQQGELYVGTKVTLAPTQDDPNTGQPSGGIFRIVPAETNVVTLFPFKDNTSRTLGSLRIPATSVRANEKSHGKAGRTLFAPAANRRAVLAFEVSGQLPPGAIITSATLSLNLVKAAELGAATVPMSLHRLTEDWGEGTSLAASGSGAAAMPGAGD